jgi:hypothetical protein
VGGAGAIGAALPALGVIGGGIALAVGLFSKKVKELDSGIRATITQGAADVDTYRRTETSRLFGLLKSKDTKYQSASSGLSNSIGDSVDAIQGSILKAAEAFGYGADRFARFSYKFNLSLKDMDDEAKMSAISAELQKLGDNFAAMLPHFSSMNELMAAASQRYDLETRLLTLQGKESELLARYRAQELEATHNLNQPMLRQIWALEDQARAAEEARAAMESITARGNMFRTAAEAQFAATSGQFQRPITELSASDRDLLNAIVTAIREGDINQSRLLSDIVRIEERRDMEPAA